MGHLGCKHGFSLPERPKGTIGRLLSVAPDIISCETDMLPAKRRDVRDNRRRDIDALEDCRRHAAPPFSALSKQGGYAHIRRGYFYTNLVGTPLALDIRHERARYIVRYIKRYVPKTF